MTDQKVRNSITQEQETWKDIPGYEGLYSVSNTGRVKSIDRVVANSGDGLRRIKGRILSQYLNNSGYLKVSLYKENKKKNYFTHRIVLQSFRPVDNDSMHANHIDGKKLNNFLSNLEWTTRSENMTHASENSLLQRGEESHRSKLTKNNVLKIRELYALGEYSQYELGRMFEVHQAHVSDIVLRKKWAHV